jgi:hypothetical protein
MTNLAIRGSVEARKETQKTIPLPPLVGGVTLVGGIVLVLVGARRVKSGVNGTLQ